MYSALLLKNAKYRYIYDYIIENTPFLNDPFYTLKTKIYCILNDVTKFPKCQNPKCHNVIEHYNITKMNRGFKLYCCNKCRDECKYLAVEKFRKTCLERFGCEAPGLCPEIKEKQRDTLEANYGVRSSPFASKKIRDISDATKLELYGEKWNNREKARKTTIDRYGVDHIMKVPEIINRKNATMLERYGVMYPLQSDEIKLNTQNTNIERYGVPSIILLDENKNLAHAGILKTSFNEYILKNPLAEPLFDEDFYINTYTPEYEYRWKCRICGKEFKSMWFSGQLLNKCSNCFKNNGQSKEEFSVMVWLKSVTKFDVLSKQRILLRENQYPLEIDIYIPEIKFGIEYDGLYIHSIECSVFEKPYEIGYHLQKTKLSENQGIRFIHIRSDQWQSSQMQYQPMIIDFLNNDYSKYLTRNPDSTYSVDRSLLNKVWFNNSEFQVIGEKEPTIIAARDKSERIYHYEDCGKLILEKLNEN